MSSSRGDRWTVVLPVKSLSSAKSRIDPARQGAGGRLALAFFRDTATAALASPDVAQVVVATSDAEVAREAEALGCTVVDDTGHPGINAAARHAAQALRITGPVAVTVTDLPCLTPAALAAVLSAATAHGAVSFLADAEGTGTTMWLDPTGGLPQCLFGVDSAHAHRLAGAYDLAAEADPAMAPARRDVDTEADLVDARDRGVGPATWQAMGDAAATTELDPQLIVTELIVTAVAHAAGGDVTVVDEDGRRRLIPWPSVAAAGLREVRPGQRLVLEDSGRVRLP